MRDVVKSAYSGIGSYSSNHRRGVIVAALLIVVVAIAYGGWVVYQKATTVTVTAYFANADGIYSGDNVKMMGVDIGAIDSITPDGDKMKVVFHFDGSRAVPADAKAVILSPTLVSARSIQLAPAYTGGKKMSDGATIPLQRTAVPVEWDDFRAQLESLSKTLSDTSTGPNGPLGDFVSSAADALRGKGDTINTTLDKLSGALGTLSDGRTDLFATIRNLQVFISALASSDDQMAQFNVNVADVTSALSNSNNELGGALSAINGVAANLARFVADNRDNVSDTSAKLARITSTLKDNEPYIEQILHVGPTAFSDFYNIYQPAQGTLTGALAVTQFQNPIQFICGAIQAATREGAAESARRCAQYVGPVLKNLQFNYPPVGANLIQGVDVRPEQIDYSENRLRPGPGQVDTNTPGVFADAPGSNTDSTSGPLVKAGSGLSGLMGVPTQAPNQQAAPR